jgi:hypothetical protein
MILNIIKKFIKISHWVLVFAAGMVLVLVRDIGTSNDQAPGQDYTGCPD